MSTLFLSAVVMSGGGILQAIIWLVIAGLVFWILQWGLGQLGLPEPFAKIAQVLLVLLVVILVINALMMILGTPFIRF